MEQSIFSEINEGASYDKKNPLNDDEWELREANVNKNDSCFAMLSYLCIWSESFAHNKNLVTLPCLQQNQSSAHNPIPEFGNPWVFITLVSQKSPDKPNYGLVFLKNHIFCCPFLWSLSWFHLCVRPQYTMKHHSCALQCCFTVSRLHVDGVKKLFPKNKILTVLALHCKKRFDTSVWLIRGKTCKISALQKKLHKKETLEISAT